MFNVETKVQILMRQAVAQCLLCYQPPCTAACPCGCDPAGMMLCLRVGDEGGAIRLAHAAEEQAIFDCHGECMAACVRRRMGAPVNIKPVHLALRGEECPE